MFDRLRLTRWLAAALCAAALIVIWIHSISGSRVEKDAAQNVQLAFNLERHGVVSMEEDAPYVPSNYREPLPVFVSAVTIKLIDMARGPAPSGAYVEGERVRLLKYQNILWLSLLSIGTFLAIRVLSSSFYLALLGVLLINYPLVHNHAEIDDLYTEIPAAALLMSASLSLANSIRTRTVGSAVLAGLLFGMLTLTKAAILYVFAGTVAVIAGIYLLQRPGVPLRRAAALLLAMLLSFACVIGPWIYRNHLQLGTYHISQRAGVVLMGRAVNDLMGSEEYRGTFYVWAHPRLKGILGRLLGFSSADLERHGRLQHLNDGDSEFGAEDLAAERAGEPEKTLSYYRQGRAERIKLIKEFEAAGKSQPEIAADDALRNQAMVIIQQHPWRHLALTVSFLWRGAVLSFPVLVLVLWFSVRRRQYDLIAFAITALGALLLYALSTPFIGRYNVPALPIATVSLLVAVKRAIPTTRAT